MSFAHHVKAFEESLRQESIQVAESARERIRAIMEEGLPEILKSGSTESIRSFREHFSEVMDGETLTFLEERISSIENSAKALEKTERRKNLKRRINELILETEIQQPLHAAAHAGDVELLRFLLEEGHNPNAKYREQTVLEFLLSWKNPTLEAFRLLEERGVDLPGIEMSIQYPAILEYLLEHGIVPSSQDLYDSLAKKHFDSSRILLKHGNVDLNSTLRHGHSFLDIAILSKAGEDILLTILAGTRFPEKSLHFTISTGYALAYEKITETVSWKNADTNGIPSKEFTPVKTERFPFFSVNPQKKETGFDMHCHSDEEWISKIMGMVFGAPGLKSIENSQVLESCILKFAEREEASLCERWIELLDWRRPTTQFNVERVRTFETLELLLRNGFQAMQHGCFRPRIIPELLEFFSRAEKDPSGEEMSRILKLLSDVEENFTMAINFGHFPFLMGRLMTMGIKFPKGSYESFVGSCVRSMSQKESEEVRMLLLRHIGKVAPNGRLYVRELTDCEIISRFFEWADWEGNESMIRDLGDEPSKEFKKILLSSSLTNPSLASALEGNFGIYYKYASCLDASEMERLWHSANTNASDWRLLNVLGAYLLEKNLGKVENHDSFFRLWKTLSTERRLEMANSMVAVKCSFLIRWDHRSNRIFEKRSFFVTLAEYALLHNLFGSTYEFSLRDGALRLSLFHPWKYPSWRGPDKEFRPKSDYPTELIAKEVRMGRCSHTPSRPFSIMAPYVNITWHWMIAPLRKDLDAYCPAISSAMPRTSPGEGFLKKRGAEIVELSKWDWIGY